MREVLLLLLIGCGPGQDGQGNRPDPAADLIAPVDFEPQPFGVVDVALDAGAHHGSSHLERGRACVVADFDGDDRLDLYLGNPGDPSMWLRNVTEPGGALRFEPQQVLADRGVLWGATAGDIDNDGDVDLFASVGGNESSGVDRLFRNDGAGVFTDVSERAGVLGGRDGGLTRVMASAGATMVDFDADGWLDIWVNVNAVPASSIDLDDPDSTVGRNVLWRNRGDGTYGDMAVSAGLTTRARTRHSSWLDIDGDGDLDLYENNFQGRNVLWQNQLAETGDATFVDVTSAFSLAGTDLGFPLSSFASATADMNQDGWEDLIVFSRGWPTTGPHRDGHALFLNAAGRGFVEASGTAGFNAFFDPYLVAGEGGTDCGDVVKTGDRELDVFRLGVMGASVADLNMDGVPELLVGNGGPGGGMYDQLFLSTALVEIEVEGVGRLKVPQYMNGSEWTDAPAPQDPSLPEYGTYPYKSHGMCVADLDDDGAVEVFVVNGGPSFGPDDVEREPNRLFRFDFGTRRVLKVRLSGDGVAVNRSAIGARVDVTVHREDGRSWTLTDRLRGSNGFSAQHGPELIFGLGDAVWVDSVVVGWTDGTSTTLAGIAPDVTVVVAR
ncbi:MAG: hypothetical protein ACI9K2_007303 [Myxococcota bacterium]